MTERPSWDYYFMEIAGVVASRSTCIRRMVGAVLVLNKRILATGYNGAPTGLTHCREAGCLREQHNIPAGERHELCRGLHAEQNAVIQAAVHGVAIAGSTLYCTVFPCTACAKILVNAGVEAVITGEDYPDDLAKNIFAEAGIMVKSIDS